VGKNDTFIQNGDNLVEIVEYMRQSYPFVSSSLLANSSVLGSYSLETYLKSLQSNAPPGTSSSGYSTPDPKYLMKSLINYEFGGYLQLFKTEFRENFLFEPSFTPVRSLIAYGTSLYGQLDLWEA